MAINLDPKDASAYNNRGYAYCRLERYQEAIDDYTQSRGFPAIVEVEE